MSLEQFLQQLYVFVVVVAELISYPFQRILGRNVCKSGKRLHGQVVVITGGNTGIGKMTALLCAKRGAKVIIGCRNLDKGNAAAEDIRSQVMGASLSVTQVDLNSLEAVRRFAENLLREEQRIDILVNNAGIVRRGKRRTTSDGFEAHFGVNYLSHFLLTILLVKRIQNSPKGKIVNISSEAHRFDRMHFEDINLNKTYSTLNAYSQSKLAQILFTQELAKRCPSINVYAVHPGVVATELDRDFNKTSFTYELYQKYVARDVYEGTQTTLYCIVDEKAEKESGLYYKDCHSSTPSKQARITEDAKTLWDLSLKLLHLNSDIL